MEKLGVENINPSITNEIVGLYASASADDAKTAIAAAKAAFPAWSRSGILERQAILKIFLRQRYLWDLQVQTGDLAMSR
jgi:acyl-CoA reductase-like NAD-dependent aldehyde dehydrogenase